MDTFETKLVDEQLIPKFKEIIPNYTKDWSFGIPDDLGYAVANLFFEMYDTIAQKSNQLPEKNKIAFLNTMNVKRTSAFAAKTTFQFSINEQTQKKVYIPKGTQITDEAENIFETVSDFYATNAKLSKTYFYEPKANSIYDVGVTTDQGMDIVNSNFDKNIQKLAMLFSNPEFEFLKGKIRLELVFAFSIMYDVQLFLKFLDKTKLDWCLLGKDDSNNMIEFALTALPQMDKNCILLFLESQNDVQPSKISIYGIDSFWLKCDINTNNTQKVPSFGKIQLNITDVSKSLNVHVPELMFSNDIKLAPKRFQPFGNLPVTDSVFYICDTVLAKKNCEINIKISHDDSQGILVNDIANGRALSWEYWNGKVWQGLELSGFFYDPPSLSLMVSFVIPSDFETCNVNGISRNWIRLKLLSGNYGSVKFDFTRKNDSYMYAANNDNIHAPLITKIKISGRSKLVESKIDKVVIYNNLQYQLYSCNSDYIFNCIDDASVLLLGLDKPIKQGPIQFMFLLGHQDYSPEQVLDFYYYDGNSWKELYVEDETIGLSRNGIIRMYLPAKIYASDIFGSNLFWIKIGCKKQDAVRIKRIILNCINGANSVRTQEIFDSIHKSTNLILHLENHIIEESVLEVWVDETKSSSESQKSEMEKNQQLETIDGKNWVLWSKVDLLYDSKPTDRHFVADKASKTIMFGNNINGKTPPTGQQNIRVRYDAGGGKAGNKPAFALNSLIKNIPLVESVTNPIPAEGGLDIENISQVLWRGPNVIMNHGRSCITSDDFVWALLSEFPILYKVECFFENNNLEIITVPNSLESRPTPDKNLIIRITNFVQAHTPPNLTAERIRVHGPEYVHVSVNIKVEITCTNDETAQTKNVIRKLLDDYLHVSSGKNMQGWNFGQCINYYDMYSMIEEIDTVNSVSLLTVSGFDKDNNQIFHSDVKNPVCTISPKSLVCNSFDHFIEIIMRIKKK